MFKPLHIAIREVIDIYGLSILSDRLFINFLSDYGAFTEVEGRADKRILEDIATDGFFQKLYYSVSGQKGVEQRRRQAADGRRSSELLHGGAAPDALAGARSRPAVRQLYAEALQPGAA